MLCNPSVQYRANNGKYSEPNSNSPLSHPVRGNKHWPAGSQRVLWELRTGDNSQVTWPAGSQRVLWERRTGDNSQVTWPDGSQRVLWERRTGDNSQITLTFTRAAKLLPGVVLTARTWWLRNQPFFNTLQLNSVSSVLFRHWPHKEHLREAKLVAGMLWIE